MKKSILMSAVLFMVTVSITSCKKDYVCKCSKTYTGSSATVTTDYSQYTYKDTRTRAEDRCNANSETSSDIFGDYAINCSIQ